MTTKRVVANLDEEELKMLDEIQKETGFSAYKVIKKSIRLFYHQFKKSQRNKTLVHNQNETVEETSAYVPKENINLVHSPKENSQPSTFVKLSPDELDDALDIVNRNKEFSKHDRKMTQAAESRLRAVHGHNHLIKHAPEHATSDLNEIEKQLDSVFDSI